MDSKAFKLIALFIFTLSLIPTLLIRTSTAEEAAVSANPPAAADKIISIKYSTLKYLLDHSIFSRDPNAVIPEDPSGLGAEAKEDINAVIKEMEKRERKGKDINVILPEAQIRGKTNFNPTLPQSSAPQQQ